jgi:outer membrane protein OmpA-like peptidoglycan-associated protein
LLLRLNKHEFQEEFAMNTKGATRSILPVLAALLLAVSISGYAQDAAKAPQSEPAQATGSAATIVHVPAGQQVSVEGLVIKRGADTFTMQDLSGKFYVVTLSNNTEVKERKSNPFRGAKNYAVTEILRGLTVEVKGRGDSSGTVVAQSVRFRNDDLRVAQSLQAGINPVEQQLKQAETRLAEAEQNQQRLSGQVEELQAISNAARGGAKAAQETADQAVKSADAAAKSAEEAKGGVRATNERITSLDDFDVKEAVTVNFRFGSSDLSKEAKERLDKLAEETKTEKGFLIEVTGYASSDGNDAYNQRLSQRRADAVIQYLAENFNIPIRRFVTPLGYGEKQPVADNKTRAGREQNRRVEVKILVNKGLAQPMKMMASGPAGGN